jgi:large subunit ribosomal protein L9
MYRPGISAFTNLPAQRRTSELLRQPRRWFDWDPKVTRKDGKPAITGTKAAYVASKIPVVLTRDIDGLGNKGSIIEVKRGFARNVLVPNGDAVYGTLWENIDTYADPQESLKQQVEKENMATRQVVPFEWLNGVRLEFQRDTQENAPSKLRSAITIREVLSVLSAQEQVDFLPSQLDFPESGILSVGRHTLPITLHLSVGTFTYTIRLDVKDKAEVAAAERREAELREAMKMKRPEFVLGSSRLSGRNVMASDFGESGDDMDDEEGSSDEEADAHHSNKRS